MKRKIAIISMILLAVFTSVKTFANNDKQALQNKVAAMTEEQKQARMDEIKARVEEIQYMDKSNLTIEDRKSLRQELRTMNKEAKAIKGGGIYLSFGAVIVIILLLILIL